MRRSGLASLVAIALSTSIGTAGGDPTYAFDVSPRPERVEVAPGEPFSYDCEVTLQTVANLTEFGAQGWTFGLVSDGMTVVDLTSDGTVSAGIDENPPGLVDNGFRVFEVGTHGADKCVDRTSAVSSVVLSFVRNVTLPPNGVETIARVTFVGDAPAEVDDVLSASVFFLDGCAGGG
jgi:hypothetical protein